MAYVLKNRVQETTSTSGTGAITLAGASSGYRSFASQMSVGDTTTIGMADPVTGAWAIGPATYTAANQITLGTPEETSTGSAISWAGNAATTVYMTASARSVRPQGVFSVADYGAKGDGTTNDYTAFAAAVSAMYAAKGGTIYVPYSQAGYVLGSSLVIDPGQYTGSGAITLQLNGNSFLPSHTGWCIDVKSNFFGTNNTQTVGAKVVTIEGGGAKFATSNSTAAGGVRFTDCVRCNIRDYDVTGYAAGSGTQIYISVPAEATWCEQLEITNLTGSGNLNLIYFKAYTGTDTILSFRGARVAQCCGYLSVNNAVLFRLEGWHADSVFDHCGGWYANGVTGASLFYLDGGYQGTTFLNPWSDNGQTQGGVGVAGDICIGSNFNTNIAFKPMFANVTKIAVPFVWRTYFLVAGPFSSYVPNKTFPNGRVVGNFREAVPNGGFTYYVSTTGSDTTGDGHTSASALATVTKAYSVIRDTLDLLGQTVTIQLADGTYTTQISLQGMAIGLGSTGVVIIKGNTTTPGNVVISTTSTDAVAVGAGAVVTLQGLKLQTTTAGTGLQVNDRSVVTLGAGMQFGACATRHQLINTGSTEYITADYTITADAPVHWLVAGKATVFHNAGIITASSRAFAGSAFLEVNEGSLFVKNGGSYVTTSSTGSRYYAHNSGIIQTYGAGSTLFPGGTSGFADSASFGLYL